MDTVCIRDFLADKDTFFARRTFTFLGELNVHSMYKKVVNGSVCAIYKVADIKEAIKKYKSRAKKKGTLNEEVAFKLEEYISKKVKGVL